MKCLQCEKEAINEGTYKDIPIWVCQNGHRTGIIITIDEKENISVLKVA